MHRYDTVLKELLQGSKNSILQRIAGVRIAKWLNTELPLVRQTRMDLLGEAANGKRTLVQLEFQSRNDPAIDLRMAEYSLGVRRKHGRFPKQFVLYVGAAPMRMPAALISDDHVCRYAMVDIRELEAETLLDTPFDTDALLSILARYKDRRDTIRRVLERIAKLKGERRSAAFEKLFVLAGLRKMESELEAEVRQMPITEDIMDHKIIGPAIRKGLRQGLRRGREKGREEGRQEGRREEGVAILQTQIAERFGDLPAWAAARLKALSLEEIHHLTIRVLKAKNIKELFET